MTPRLSNSIFRVTSSGNAGLTSLFTNFSVTASTSSTALRRALQYLANFQTHYNLLRTNMITIWNTNFVHYSIWKASTSNTTFSVSTSNRIWPSLTYWPRLTWILAISANWTDAGSLGIDTSEYTIHPWYLTPRTGQCQLIKISDLRAKNNGYFSIIDN